MLHIKGVIFPVCVLICLSAFCYKLRYLPKNRRDPALVALLIAFVCKAASFTLSTPAASAAVDRVTGVPNLGALGIHLFGGVASSAAILVTIAYWIYPSGEAWHRARSRLLVALCCATIMIALWAAAGPENGERSPNYLLQNANRPLVTAYLLCYVGAFGAGMVEVIRMCRRYATMAGRVWLKRGLQATCIGAGTYLVYCLNRAAAGVAVPLGLEPLDWELLTPLTNAVGISFFAVGLTIPSWGPHLSAWRRRMRNFTSYRRLHPLWLALCKANPTIALEPELTTKMSRLFPRDIDYRLYRQVIEIQDGLLALQPYLDLGSDDETTAATISKGLSRGERNAIVLAAAISDALKAKEAHCMRSDEFVDAAPANIEPVDIKPYQTIRYSDEVSWLLSVAQAYAQTPT
ncbi:MAB_1171c family putative transporter [Streptomyces atriruber]|uniref:MAB_1171c family putative transporter n=1 Tax=Streptomyces atriruber TaxID=545121 RepID=UPI0006E1E441|nr:MAB_1171c family putative transporter [Streptomyces atriruber]